MAEFVARAIVEILLGALFAHTGRKLLPLCGLKSYFFVEVVLGLIAWVVIVLTSLKVILMMEAVK